MWGRSTKKAGRSARPRFNGPGEGPLTGLASAAVSAAACAIGGWTVAVTIAARIAIGFAVALSAGSHLTSLQQAPGRGAPADPRAMIAFVATLYGVVIALSVTIGPAFRALLTNLIWSNTRLGEHRLECDLSPWMMIWLAVSNLVAVIATVGLLVPWAQIRWTGYLLSRIRLLPASDLQEFEAGAPEAVGAIGEEVASVFDFDLAL